MSKKGDRSGRRARWVRCAVGVGCACAVGCASEVDPRPSAGAQEVPSDRVEARAQIEGATAQSSAGQLRYEVVSGMRLYQGDILVPIPEGADRDPSASTASLGTINPAMLWENHEVAYAVDAAFSNPATLSAAMAVWEATTSIRFVQFNPALHTAFVAFPASVGAGCNAQAGRPIGGSIGLPASSIGNLDGCNQAAMVHELGHIIGLKHEQSRNDRDDHVIIDLNCVDTVPTDRTHNFDIETTFTDLGLYDFSSVMHYGSGAFFDDGVPSASPNFAACSSTANTLWRRTSPLDSQSPVNAQSNAPSFIDRDGVEEMYGNGMGHSVAVGDFNGDGYRDVAVGSPRAGALREGRVTVFRGSAAGLVLDTTVLQTTAPTPLDRFGYALAAGDFNNDGLADLAIGAPGELSAGRVVVMKGRAQPTSIVTSFATLSQSGVWTNDAGDRFGYALTAGDFNDDGIADLAVGAPGKQWTGEHGSGAAFVFRGGASLTPQQVIGQVALDANEAGDNFGASLARGDFDADGYVDLAVGAPHERVSSRPEAGAVYVFRGNSGPNLTALRALYASPATSEQNDMFFGFAMTASDFNNDGYADLAVGAPGATVGGARWAGRVIVFNGTSSGPDGGAQVLTAGASPVAGAAFGYSLDAGLFTVDGIRDLAVGAPGDTPTANVGSGRVHSFRGSTGGLIVDDVVSQTGTGASNEAGDRFGSSVAFGDIDAVGRAELIVGSDGKRWAGASNGRAFVFRYSLGQFSHWTNHGP